MEIRLPLPLGGEKWSKSKDYSVAKLSTFLRGRAIYQFRANLERVVGNNLHNITSYVVFETIGAQYDAICLARSSNPSKYFTMGTFTLFRLGTNSIWVDNKIVNITGAE